jgi:hypothetical protein
MCSFADLQQRPERLLLLLMLQRLGHLLLLLMQQRPERLLLLLMKLVPWIF